MSAELERVLRAHIRLGYNECSAGDLVDDGLSSFSAQHRAHLAAVLAPLVEAEKAAALREAADEMTRVIADGDVAEVAGYVPGEVGRASAVQGRDSLYEEPDQWLRDCAATYTTTTEGNES